MIPRLLVPLALLATSFGLLLNAPANADTDGAAMSLSVDPHGLTSCPQGKEASGPEPMFCVPTGGQFTLQVVADGIPLDNGYAIAQYWIHYGDELGDQSANGAIKSSSLKWFECEASTYLITNTDQTGDARLDSFSAWCLTTLFGDPSFYKGVLYEVDLTCDGGSHVIDLIPYGEAPADDNGAAFIEPSANVVVPAVTGAEINCVDGTSGECLSAEQACMSIGVVAGGSLCSSEVDVACDVPAGNSFSVVVSATKPPGAGYEFAQAYIQFSDLLTYIPASDPSEEVVWPEGFVIGYESSSDHVNIAALTGLVPPRPISTFDGVLFEFMFECSPEPSTTTLHLLPYQDPTAGSSGAMYREPQIIPGVGSLTLNCIPDSDGDGCPDYREQQTATGSLTSGGLRDYLDPNDYYDVLGPGQSLTRDGVIDLANDILGVVLHYSPQGYPPYDVRFDRGPTIGASHWERGPPDGAIDLANDILGVALQHAHNCV